MWGFKYRNDCELRANMKITTLTVMSTSEIMNGSVGGKVSADGTVRADVRAIKMVLRLV